MSVRPVYTDTYTAYTTQPYTNHTHTPTQPKTQVHSTQSKHTHTPTQPKTHPHSHTDKTHPQTHTAKNTPPLPHSVRCLSVRCPSVRCPSIRCPSVRCLSSNIKSFENNSIFSIKQTTPYDPLRSPYTSQTPQNVERKVSEANLSRVYIKLTGLCLCNKIGSHVVARSCPLTQL